MIPKKIAKIMVFATVPTIIRKKKLKLRFYVHYIIIPKKQAKVALPCPALPRGRAGGQLPQSGGWAGSGRRSFQLEASKNYDNIVVARR